MNEDNEDELLQAIKWLGEAITPSAASPAQCPADMGGHVGSLTEAGLSISAALMQISTSIDALASVLEEK